jgi:hypothetical protein
MWRCSIRTEIEILPEGILAKSIKGEILYKWERIKNIFTSSTYWLNIVDDDGNEVNGKTGLRTRRSEFKKQLENIWNQWAKHRIDKESITEFCYPIKFQEKDERENKIGTWLNLGGGVFGIIVTVQLLVNPESAERLIDKILMYCIYVFFPFFTIVLCGGMGLYSLIRKPKILRSISVTPDKILVKYTDGSSREHNKSDLLNCYFDSGTPSFRLNFKGNIICHVERVDDFGVLREKLLNIIEK